MFWIIITAPRSAQPNPLTSGRKEAATQRRARDLLLPLNSQTGEDWSPALPLCKWHPALIRSIFKRAMHRETLASSPNEITLLKLGLNMLYQDKNEK